MGESTDKPKVEGKKPRWIHHRNKGPGAQKKAFKAPTPGLEHLVFTVGDARDAANYDDVKKAIANYAGINFKSCAAQARQAIENVMNPVFTEPVEPTLSGSVPPTRADRNAEKLYEVEFETYAKEKVKWNTEAKSKAFQLCLAHCHPDVIERLESSTAWDAIAAGQDLVGLLELIRSIVHKHEEVKQGTMSLVEHQLQWMLNFQAEKEDLMDFFKAFKARADVIDTYKGNAGYHPELFSQHKTALAASLGTTVNLLTDEQNAAALASSCEEFKAALFIRLANEKAYGSAKRELDNRYLLGDGSHPKTLDSAYRFLLNYRPAIGHSHSPRDRVPEKDGVALAQSGNRALKCFNCEKNHSYRRCPDLKPEEIQAISQAIEAGDYKGGKVSVQDGTLALSVGNADLQECMDGIAGVEIAEEDVEVGSIQSADGAESVDVFDGVGFIEASSNAGRDFNCGRDLLWLDTGATEHTMFALEHLKNIRTSDVVLRQNCNAGYKLVNKIGDWMKMKFWASPDGIANLLSLVQLEETGHSVRYKTGGKMEVLTPDNQIITFEKSTGVCKGMHYIDMSRPQDFIRQATPADSFMFVETVRKNMQGFTAEAVRKASEARDGLAMMAHPPVDKLKHLVSATNVIKNVPFDAKDLTNSHEIYGPDRGAIRGKTVRHRPDKVRPVLVTIPPQLFERIKEVTLAADVMFVNGLPFFVTVSRGIKLITAEFLPSRTVEQLTKSLDKVIRVYRRGGYHVKHVLMDMEFEPLEDRVENVWINTTAAREHVGDVERQIRVIKDRARAVTSELPYKDCMPDPFVIRLVYFCVFWLNAFINDNGVSNTYSPRELVTGLKVDYTKHCRARWGAYVEASNDLDITNTQQDRTSPCIALGPTGNTQGSIWCFNLETKAVIKRRSITPLPMPDRVVKHVIALGKRARQSRNTRTRLEFLNRHRDRFAWDVNDFDEEQDLVETPHETDDLIAELPAVMLESDFESTDAIETPPVPDTAQLATAALENANLAMTPPHAEIAGVDDAEEHIVVSDDGGENENDDVENGQQDQDDDEIEFLGENLAPPAQDDDEIEFLGENLAPPAPQDVTNIASTDEEDSDDVLEEEITDDQPTIQENLATHLAALDEEDLGMQEETDSTGAVVRRSRRKKKKTQRTEIDFDNRAYAVQDGVMHLNPNVLEQAREDVKIVGDITKSNNEKAEDSRIAVRVPATAGISRSALASLGMPALPGKFLVTDSVVFHIVGVVLAQQYSINKGIELFGDRARESITKELKQLHGYKTYIPVHAHELTEEERRQALASLIFLTEKRCGKVKTRACINGSTQRGYIPKETTASPTVMNESVMITSAIDAHERRRVVTLDIPGAFLHADLDEEVVMLLRGQLADLMVQVDPETYGPYLTKNKKGESILYVRMLKAMYGLLRSALLFYLKLVKDLQEYGFEVNPYDPCVATMDVDGSQMTVAWHVDDLKISHNKQSTIDKLVRNLMDKYGENLAVHTGDVHDYLGVDHDYSKDGVVRLSMFKHINKALDDFPEDITGKATTPASDHLFEVRDEEEAEKLGLFLSLERKKIFHHSVAQLLFISTRVRRDIQTAVAFLTTRVKKPDKDDWGKLKRVLKYLKNTKHMKLTLSVDDLGIIQWWVDASYNVHWDCKGQTGAMMSFGRGAAISFSRKQKLNVRSSCEGELVGLDDALPLILWARYFIESLGYTVEQNIVYQDNKSTILLATNGRWSSSKRTKHIKSRYFFVKDKVDAGDIDIKYKPTGEMWCDGLTKPKQGKVFWMDTSMLMNCDVDYDDDVERSRTHPSLLPQSAGPVDPAAITSISTPSKPDADRRSVLGGVRKTVTWHASLNRADRYCEKARRRHMELVVARARRARGRE